MLDAYRTVLSIYFKCMIGIMPNFMRYKIMQIYLEGILIRDILSVSESAPVDRNFE